MKNIDIKKINDEYAKYSENAEKKALNFRIIENNRWFKQQYTDFNNEKEKNPNKPECKSGYIFSAICTKHADAMDNYPDINIYAREPNDVSEAEKLTSIIPCVLDICKFKEVYSSCWWYKLKNGTACYGVFWNNTLNGGLGDIEIKQIDLLNLSWQPGISDIQDSKYLFYSYFMDKEKFADTYGKDKLPQSADILSVDTYDGKSRDEYLESVLVVDAYYKKNNAVHLIKFSGENILEQTEGDERYPKGLYEHGLYPFVFDVMYPNIDSPAGFGVIDVVKNPQAYIDKMDELIADNCAVIGKTRYFIKDSGGVNEDEFADLNKPFVHVEGSLDERNILQIKGDALPESVNNWRKDKINELKEVIGNRDFQQGGTSNGVTAASAITVLQQSGDKLSRDMIASSYNAYKRIVNICVELIRQFYDIERHFRIIGNDGDYEYTTYNNANIKAEVLGDAQNEQYFRLPEFDISLVVQKSNPITKEQQNQTIMQLWGAGFFNPQMIDYSILALNCMQFEGREELVKSLQELKQQNMQMQQQMQSQQLSNQGNTQSDLVAIPIGEGGSSNGIF